MIMMIVVEETQNWQKSVCFLPTPPLIIGADLPQGMRASYSLPVINYIPWKAQGVPWKSLCIVYDSLLPLANDWVSILRYIHKVYNFYSW